MRLTADIAVRMVIGSYRGVHDPDHMSENLIKYIKLN